MSLLKSRRETRGASAQPTKLVRRVGRINFVLRSVVVVALAYSAELLAIDLLPLQLLPNYAFLIQRIAVFGLFGIFFGFGHLTGDY